MSRSYFLKRGSPTLPWRRQATSQWYCVLGDRSLSLAPDGSSTWEEGSGAGETVGAITAKRCFNGARLAQTAFAPGPPPTTPHTPFGPPLFGRRLAQRQA